MATRNQSLSGALLCVQSENETTCHKHLIWRVWSYHSGSIQEWECLQAYFAWLSFLYGKCERISILKHCTKWLRIFVWSNKTSSMFCFQQPCKVQLQSQTGHNHIPDTLLDWHWRYEETIACMWYCWSINLEHLLLHSQKWGEVRRGCRTILMEAG